MNEEETYKLAENITKKTLGFDYLDKDRTIYQKIFWSGFLNGLMYLLELKNNQKGLDGDIQKFVDDNFWDLV